MNNKANIYAIIIGFLLLITFLVINYKMTKRAIEQCVQGGNDYYTCSKDLN